MQYASAVDTSQKMSQKNEAIDEKAFQAGWICDDSIFTYSILKASCKPVKMLYSCPPNPLTVKGFDCHF
jgi:hypothetical protein